MRLYAAAMSIIEVSSSERARTKQSSAILQAKVDASSLAFDQRCFCVLIETLCSCCHLVPAPAKETLTARFSIRLSPADGRWRAEKDVRFRCAEVMSTRQESYTSKLAGAHLQPKRTCAYQ